MLMIALEFRVTLYASDDILIFLSVSCKDKLFMNKWCLCVFRISLERFIEGTGLRIRYLSGSHSDLNSKYWSMKRIVLLLSPNFIFNSFHLWFRCLEWLCDKLENHSTGREVLLGVLRRNFQWGEEVLYTSNKNFSEYHLGVQEFCWIQTLSTQR